MAESSNLISNLARSGRMRIAAALAITALVGGTLGVIILRGDQSGKSLLFSGLDLQEAAEIAGRLDTANIRYSLEGGGSAIFVDKAKVDDARMMLSEQGLPTRGSVGWEIFDKTDALGATSFVQNINKVRALEGELSRTITSMDMVRAARVHISLPERPLFQRDTEKPSASVVLRLTGNTMTPEKVRAIRNLVASSVPGLTVGAITVVDDQGRMLAAGAEGDDSGLAGGASNSDERKLNLEESYRKKVLEIVENIAGIGAARVEVALDVDFNRVTQSAETFDPDSRVVRSSETTEKTSSSTERSPGDETTVANNIPTGAEGAAVAQPSSNNQQSESSEKVDYLVSKTTRSEIIEGGGIKRISVAVAVDDMRVPGADGAPATFQSRSPEEIQRILTLVRSAVGFSDARGDVVTVENIPFARPDATLDGGEAPGPFAFDKNDIIQGVEVGAMLITALALVLFVLRPLAKGILGKDDDANKTPSLSPNRALPPDAAGAQAIGLDVGPAPPERKDPGIDVARISGQVKASSIKKISEVVASHPDESLNIIRTWLSEETREGAV
ncbi:MAG: flagellar basal-body MS-ring/collar protein FliF [Hyphomonadaceae bacterium]